MQYSTQSATTANTGDTIYGCCSVGSIQRDIIYQIITNKLNMNLIVYVMIKE